MKKLFPYLMVTLLGLFILTLSADVVEAQCPMCKAAVTSAAGDGESEMAGGLNIGIMYLFALPYTAFMIVGFVWYRGYRKLKKRELAEQLAENQAADLPKELNPNPPTDV